jgi:ketosteroid isomerase-like protein
MTELETLGHRRSIEETIYAFAAGLDRKDWDGLIALFTEDVTFDYSSHSGGKPVETTAKTWFGRLGSARPGYDQTQQSLSNFRCRIDGDAAEVEVYVRAEHFLAAAGVDDQTTMGGYYDFALVRHADRWLIRLCRLNVLWKTGNLAIYDLALGGA